MLRDKLHSVQSASRQYLQYEGLISSKRSETSFTDWIIGHPV